MKNIRFKGVTRPQQGFSLVELMIVVGMLAGIAVMMSRSLSFISSSEANYDRQAEAKTMIRSMMGQFKKDFSLKASSPAKWCGPSASDLCSDIAIEKTTRDLLGAVEDISYKTTCELLPRKFEALNFRKSAIDRRVDKRGGRCFKLLNCSEGMAPQARRHPDSSVMAKIGADHNSPFIASAICISHNPAANKVSLHVDVGYVAARGSLKIQSKTFVFRANGSKKFAVIPNQ